MHSKALYCHNFEAFTKHCDNVRASVCLSTPTLSAVCRPEGRGCLLTRGRRAKQASRIVLPAIRDFCMCTFARRFIGDAMCAPAYPLLIMILIILQVAAGLTGGTAAPPSRSV
jgi:hypothetical protein